MPGEVSNVLEAVIVASRHTEQGIECWFDLAATSHQHSLDNFGVYVWECLDQGVLGLNLWARRSRWLRWREFVFGKADFGFW